MVEVSSTDVRPSPTPTVMEIQPSESISPEVLVQGAKEDFSELERQLSRVSTLHRSSAPSDPEKGDHDEETFNLRDYLMSANAAQDDAGITNHHKRVGVTWHDLEVIVPGGGDFKIYIKTFGKAVIEFFIFPFVFVLGLFHRLRAQDIKVVGTPILHKNSGVIKPGEMCLVLGCPGAGCTTFLKTISNQREGYAYIGGDVRYAGISASEMEKRYKGEVVYNGEDDIHIPTLTVGQTLSFALSTKTPGKRLPGVSRKEFNARLLQTFLKMFNIRHTERTLVGNAFVRGVSGGERKRVSIAEMMATRAHVTCWDNSTRGLDASTALDYVKSLRVLTDVMQQTTFVSLYQASESIYKQFDKVLVIDKGHQVYYGPADQARNYFISLGYKDLPRQTSADYLTGCTDPNQRQFAPGQSTATVPSTPAALEEAWRASSLFRTMNNDRQWYEKYVETEKEDQEAFRSAVLQDKKKGVSKKSPYTLGFRNQVWALTVRQFSLRLQDKFQLYTSFSMSIGLSIILGATFYNLPPTANGGFTRGSVIFIAMLVSCLDAFGEVHVIDESDSHAVLYKQTNYGFYRPAAIAVANMLADLPFSTTRLFIFNVIIYFMTNLSRSAGGFFTFHLFQMTTFLAMQAFFRFFGVLCTNFDTAFRLATFFIPNFISYAGYFQPPSKMKRWLFWIYYVNPLSYGFGGLMDNEFMRTNLSCDGNFVVPRNIPGVPGQPITYPATLGPNQACTLFGATLGSDTVLGTNYLQVGFGLDKNNIWRMELVVLIGMFIIFQILQLLVLEFYKHGTGGAGINIFIPENAETVKLNAKLRASKESASSDKDEKETDEKPRKNVSSGKPFTWEKLNYHVPVPGGQRRLLHDVYGYVKPGSLTALMGASGAGKTTCLDVLAQRKNIGVVSGDVLVAGRPLDAGFARGTAYAEQMDVHEGTTTVREAMRFSANLRQPFSVPQAEKDEYVEEMIELLELNDLADALVMTLGVEARKRLTIGVELAAKPELLLFLDEPTSGLDGQSAWNLVRFLRKLADAGQAILCTIHQPSSLLFESFDRLLLLKSGGETVYFGDIGRDSSVITEYFARHGAFCPADVNPAEYMLEAIGAGVTPQVGSKDWKDVWLDSPECARVKEEIRAMNSAALSQPAETNKELTRTYATPFLYQVKTVTSRSLTALWRSADYVWTRLFVHAFISLFVSLSLLQLGNSSRDLQSRVFGIFFATIMPAIVMLQIEPAFIMNRMIFIREASSRIYSPYVFAISQLISEIPYSVLCAIVYWVLMVWPMGFGKGQEGTNGNGYQLLMCIFLELFGVSLGQLIGAISPSVQIATLYNPPLSLILSTFAGVTIPFPQLAHFWKSWLYQLTPYTRVLSGMLSTELHGLTIACQGDEFAVFNPPSGQTCQTWAGQFQQIAGGYLDNPSATELCRYCQYKVGDEYFTPLNIEFSNRWRDVFILFAYFIANILFTVVASRFLRFAKR
ncbi:ABC-2 type transporter-domain-containing protein [Gautieria morchelliformis]|nr:ABC-2 type transporter-domain-containing protein [Gautieria morchelliformis]